MSRIRIAGAQHNEPLDMNQPMDDMPTIPIPARTVTTSFETAPQHERIERKPLLVRLTRRLVTGIFGLWASVSTRIGRQLGWFPKVEPYVGYGTDDYSRLICRTTFGPAHSPSGKMVRGLRAMLMVPAARTRVRIAIDGVPLETVQIGESQVYDQVDRKRDTSCEYAVSDGSGYLDLVAERQLTTGVHRVSYEVANRPAVTSNLYAIAPGTRVGVITDVDDTIMVTQAPKVWKAAYNLLLSNPHNRAAVPGMNVFFSKIADLFPQAPFFYLSTSPWNIESSIRHFIGDQGYPEGPLLLRDLDPRPKTFISSGAQHKFEFTDQLMHDFPQMKFILIGDDGQRDPTTYATIARRYPGRVLAIGIRQLSPRQSSPIGVVSGLSATQPMPVTDVPVFSGTTGANLMKTMLPYLEGLR